MRAFALVLLILIAGTAFAQGGNRKGTEGCWISASKSEQIPSSEALLEFARLQVKHAIGTRLPIQVFRVSNLADWSLTDGTGRSYSQETVNANRQGLINSFRDGQMVEVICLDGQCVGREARWESLAERRLTGDAELMQAFDEGQEARVVYVACASSGGGTPGEAKRGDVIEVAIKAPLGYSAEQAASYVGRLIGAYPSLRKADFHFSSSWYFHESKSLPIWSPFWPVNLIEYERHEGDVKIVCSGGQDMACSSIKE